MSLEDLKKELGSPLTYQDIAELFGIDVRTVRKYSVHLGGVEVAPGRHVFFENRIRRLIDANDRQESWEQMARQGQDQRDREDKAIREGAEVRSGVDQSQRVGNRDAAGACNAVLAELKARALTLGLGCPLKLIAIKSSSARG